MSFPLRRMAGLYRGAGPWTTVQIDVGRDAQDAGHALELRWQGLREDLAGRGAPASDLATIDSVLETPIEAGASACRYVIVGRSGVVVDEPLYGVAPCANQVSYSVIPPVTPLIEGNAHDLPYVVVEAGRDGYRITAFRVSGRTTFVDEVLGAPVAMTLPSAGLPDSHNSRRSTEVWQESAPEVAEHVERIRRHASAQLIVLCGETRSRERVVANLSARTISLVAEADIRTRLTSPEPGAVLREVAGRLSEIAEGERQRVIERWSDGRRNGHAVAGAGPTVDALRNAQVDVLIIDIAALAGHRLLTLTDEPWVATTRDGLTDTQILAEAPAVEALIRAGALTDALLLPLQSDRIPEADDVAAVLR